MRGRERELHYVGNTGHTVEPMLVLYGMSGGKWGYQNLAAGILLHWKGCVGVRPETQLAAASNRCFFNTWFSWGEGFPGGSVVEDPPANTRDTGDPGLIPGLGKSPGGGHGNPLQYSSLGNPMNRGAWWATVQGITIGQIRLSDWAHIHTL